MKININTLDDIIVLNYIIETIKYLQDKRTPKEMRLFQKSVNALESFLKQENFYDPKINLSKNALRYKNFRRNFFK